MLQLADQPGQLYNEKTGRGYSGQIYFGNEEIGNEGRSFGVTDRRPGAAAAAARAVLLGEHARGTNRGDTTYAMGQEDAASGQLWVYVGQKQSTGPRVRQGRSHQRRRLRRRPRQRGSVQRCRCSARPYGKNIPAPLRSRSHEEVDWDQPGARQNAEALAEGLTLNRIEDGAFDPNHPNDFYFVTTEGAPAPARPPVRVTAAASGGSAATTSSSPRPGGTLTLLLDGSEAPFLNKPDNVDMDTQRPPPDPGGPGQQRPARSDRRLRRRHRRARRGGRVRPGAVRRRARPGFITQDEESSGIIDASK